MASAQNLVSDQRETIQGFIKSTFIISSGREIKCNHLREYLNIAFSVLVNSPKNGLEKCMFLGKLFQKR